MQTKIFLDSGDPKETAEMLSLLGSLDGQTTNPSLIASAHKKNGKIALSTEGVEAFYKDTVQKISALIPGGSVSVEVYADSTTPVTEMVKQAMEMNAWIPNAHIKLPTTLAGLEVAHILTSSNIRVNMTLVFTQQQAAAVHESTKALGDENIFVSPFVGRLDDIGESGLSLVENIMQMYASSDHHVAVLAASIRDLDTFVYLLEIGVDIVTAPVHILRAWAEAGKPEKLSAEKHTELRNKHKEIPYESIDLSKDVSSFQITHQLTKEGLQRFADDWNALIQK